MSVQDDIEHAHTTIRAIVAELRACEDEAEARRHVARLANILPSHFAYEEREGGFFDRIAQRALEGEEALGELRNDHAGLLEEVRELTAGQGDLARLRAFGIWLARHEQRENQLAVQHHPDWR